MHPSTEGGIANDELKSNGRERRSSTLRGDPNERKEPHPPKSVTEQTSVEQSSTNPARTLSSCEPSATSVSAEPFAGQTNEESFQLRTCKTDQKATLNCPELPVSYTQRYPRASFSVGSTSSSSPMTMTIRSLDLASSSEKQSQRKTTQLSPELTPLLSTCHVQDPTVTSSSVDELDDEIVPSIIEQLNALDLAKIQSRITKNCATNHTLLAQASLPSPRASEFKSQQSDNLSQRSPINKSNSLEHGHCLHPSPVTLGAEKLMETGSTTENISSLVTSVALKLSGRSQIETCIEAAVNPEADHVGDSCDVRKERDTQRGDDADAKAGKTLVQSSKLMDTKPAAVSPSTVRLSSLSMSSSVQPNRHDEEMRAHAMEEVETNKSWILRSATRSKKSSIRPQW